MCFYLPLGPVVRMKLLNMASTCERAWHIASTQVLLLLLPICFTHSPVHGSPLYTLDLDKCLHLIIFKTN